MSPIRYQGKTSRRVRIHIDPATEFRKILRTFEEMELPECGHCEENVKFAVLELVNNSLRAHREKQVSRPISVIFEEKDGSLEVSIRDRGGGFDPGTLPWRLDGDHRLVDTQSHAFQEYREKHDHLRFGMGLLVARRTFARFELVFLDAQDQPIPWDSGHVAGTLIRLGTGGGENVG
jgi:anti-sigma regulatory factor (Ser/Thr protein kinase)